MMQENLSCGMDGVAISTDTEMTTDFESAASNQSAGTDGNGNGNQNQPQSDAFLTTLFNHETRQLSRNEAEQLVQIGLYSKPHIDRLKYLARLSGEGGVKELLNRLISEGEQRLTDDISGKVADPSLAKQITEQRLAQLREAMPDDEAERANKEAKDDINHRLAEEFLQLQSEFPETQDFAQLPLWVKERAALEGVPLKYAYALYICKEQEKIQANLQSQQKAAEHSARSLKSDASEGTSPEMASVYKALWGQY